MVSVREKVVKGRTYVYVSTSVTYKGEKKVFERSVGPKDIDPDKLQRRIDFYSNLLKIQRHVYRVYMEVKDTKFKYLPKGYAFPIILAREQYNEYLSGLYPNELEKYRQEFEVRYVHNTTAIEGNTLSLRDTAMLLEDGITPKTKELREIHEISNYKRLIEYVENYEGDIDNAFILKTHELIQRNIDDNSAGSYRRLNVGIQGSKWEPSPAAAVPDEMDELIDWHDKNKKEVHPVELAGIFHHKFLQTHPFLDGNGRVGRELLNFILIKNNYPPVIIPVERRDEYLDCLEKADAGDVQPLLEFIVLVMLEDYAKVMKNVVVGITEQIEPALEDLTLLEIKEIISMATWFLDLMKDYLMDIPKPLDKIVSKVMSLPPES